MKNTIRALLATVALLVALSALLLAWEGFVTTVFPAVFTSLPPWARVAAARVDNGPVGQAARALSCAVDADTCMNDRDDF